MFYIVLALVAIGIVVFSIIILMLTRYMSYPNYYGNSDYYGRSDCDIIWFYRPGCGYCTRMNDEWEKFAAQAPSYIQLYKINVSNPKYVQMANEYDVTGVPHIVKEKNGRRTVFKGQRTASEFYKFAME